MTKAILELSTQRRDFKNWGRIIKAGHFKYRISKEDKNVVFLGSVLRSLPSDFRNQHGDNQPQTALLGQVSKSHPPS